MRAEPRKSQANRRYSVFGSDKRRDRLTLDSAEIGVPNIANEDDAKLIGWIRRFMLNGVVEYKGFSTLPVSPFGTDTKPAACRHNERKMADQPSIVDADMRWNLGPWRKQRKHRIGRGTRYHWLGKSFEQFESARTMAGVGLDLMTVLP